jgi:hypothetical protein
MNANNSTLEALVLSADRAECILDAATLARDEARRAYHARNDANSTAAYAALVRADVARDEAIKAYRVASDAVFAFFDAERVFPAL